MHTILKAKAQAMSEFLVSKRRFSVTIVGASPFLDMLIDLLKELLPVIIGCFATPKEALDSVQNGLNFFQQWRLKRQIKKHLDDADMSARMLESLTEAFVEVAKATTEQEAETLFQSI